MQITALTDCGKKRINNEDYYMTSNLGKLDIMIIADGMGGAEGGEVASKIGVETMMDYLKNNLIENMSPQKILLRMREAINTANSAIYKKSMKDGSLQGMGTTADICITDGETSYIAHVGDSRVYKVTGKKAVPVTKDHSLTEYMVETGAITRSEAENHPQKNVITRALGTNETVEADTYITPIFKGDTILMCTDGLTNMISDDEIYRAINESENPTDAAHMLIRLANDAGGDDNITVILAEK